MISLLHRKILSSKAESRADPARRAFPPLPGPIPRPAPIPVPVSHGRIRVSANSRVYRFRQIAQLRPWHPSLAHEPLPPLRLIDLRHPQL